MQKVTYINLYGEAVSFSGGPPLLLESVSGLSRPGGKLVTAQGAYQAGQTIYRAQLEARKIPVTFSIFGCDTREKLYEQREKLETALSYGRCVRDGKCGQLIYENDRGVWLCDAVPEGEITYGKRFLNTFPGCKVSFTAAGAYLKTQKTQGAVLRMGSGGFTLPAKLPVKLGTRLFAMELKNAGAVDAPLEITIYGTGETPRIINHTTGAEIAVGKVIETGSRLVIDTDGDDLSCVLIGADGSETDAFGYLDASIAVSSFTLAPGINSVEYVPNVPSGGSRVELSWRTLYEGV